MSRLEALDPRPPANVRLASFDIESSNFSTGGFPDAAKGDLLESIGLEVVTLYGDPVCAVYFSLRQLTTPLVSEAEVRVYDTERELLEGFAKTLASVAPAAIMAHNGAKFDWLFIANAWARITGYWDARTSAPNPRALLLMMSTLNAPEVSYREVKKDTQQHGAEDVAEVRVEGMHVLDTMWFAKTVYPSLSSYSLNALAVHVLGEGDDNAKHDISPAELFRAFAGKARPDEAAAHGGSADAWQRDRLREVGDYCMQDVSLLRRIADKTKMYFTLCAHSTTTYTNLQDYVYGGQQLKSWNLLGQAVVSADYYINRSNLPPPPDSFVGATVLDAKADLYTEEITCVDFASLYPSCIVAWNLSFDTLLFRHGRLRTPEEEGLAREDCVMFVLGAEKGAASQECVWFVKKETRRGALPDILVTLWDARKLAKKKMKAARTAGDEFVYSLWDATQKSIKVAMNALYGFTGVRDHARLSCHYIAQVTTLQGRTIIGQTKEIAESNYSVDVIYGTDRPKTMNVKVPLYNLVNNRRYGLAFHSTHVDAAAAVGRSTRWHERIVVCGPAAGGDCTASPSHPARRRTSKRSLCQDGGRRALV